MASGLTDGGGNAALTGGACPNPPLLPPGEVVAPAEGEIAFVTTRGGAADIYVVGANGSDEHALTRNRPVPNAVDRAPAPDCRFAFSSQDAGTGRSYVWIASPDTRELRRLVEGDDPRWSPDGTRLAFSWSSDLDFRDRRNGVYVIAADGSGRRQLARTRGDSGRVAWAPDGTALAYTDDSALWRIELATGRRSELLEHTEPVPPDVAWSHDGATLALVAGLDIVALAAEGGHVRRLTSTPDTPEEALAWRPDGALTFLVRDERSDRYVVFALRPQGAAAPAVTRLFAVDADSPPRLDWSSDGTHALVTSGAGPRVTIVRADGTDPRPVLAGDTHRGPAWSPDGSRLAFATAATMASFAGGPLAVVEGATMTKHGRTNCMPPLSWAPDGRRLTCDDSLGGNVALVTLGPGGGTSKAVLTDHGIGDAMKNSADWEPNGRRLVYVLEGGLLALYRVDRLPAPPLSYGTVIRIRGLTAAADTPAWSPDGRRIAFRGACETRGRRCRPGIYVVRVDGTALRRLSPVGANPDWSPDGKQIVFDAKRNGNRDVYSVDLNARGLRRLTTSPAPDFDPSWRP